MHWLEISDSLLFGADVAKFPTFSIYTQFHSRLFSFSKRMYILEIEGGNA
jgi:hypothetical protein